MLGFKEFIAEDVRKQGEVLKDIQDLRKKTALLRFKDLTYEICKRQPEVFDAYRRGRAETTVQVVSALMDAIQRGDMRAIQFWLKTQAGWSEKHQLEIAKAEQGDNIEDRHWTFEVVGDKPERLPPREINFVRTGMIAVLESGAK